MRVLLALLLLCVPALARDPTLVWSPSPTEGVVGYKVYYGTASRNYSTVLYAGLMLDYTVKGLDGATRYYFAVTAYTSDGESDFSNEVSAIPNELGMKPAPPTSLQIK